MNTNDVMTPEQRTEQLISMAYGNVHMEHPKITLELARECVYERILNGDLDNTKYKIPNLL